MEILTVLARVAEVCGLIMSVAGCFALFIKPLRAKLFGFARWTEGQKCLLRSAMLQTYYKGKENHNTLRQYDFENFTLLYAAYKAEGGNSFIDKINHEVQEMEVIT